MEGGTVMFRRHRVPMSIGLSGALLAGLALAGPAFAAGSRLTASMTGAEEVPGPGDADGSGTAVIRLNKGKGEVCYELTVSGITPATAAHIHVGPPGVAGPVVVPLAPPASGSVSACATGVDVELIKAIAKNPGDYYVNVHNVEFPAGAIRGQLSK